MKKISFLLISVLTGCQALPQETPASNELLMQQAREALSDGEFYKARQLAKQVLESEPASEEAQKLMAQILDSEISRHKRAFDTNAPEEISAYERREEAKTWLERARELLRQKQYEEALGAAEKVFTFDPENVAASSLIDEIRRQVFAEGKQDTVFLTRMYQDEIQERIVRYKSEARHRMDNGEWGPAKLSIRKILLLTPNDPEAQELLKEIEQHERVLH